MTDKCLKCSQEIKLGKLVEKEGKKFYEKFNLDNSPHVCVTKDATKKQFIPAKPREEILFQEFRKGVLPDGKTEFARVYQISRTGFIGELDFDKNMAEMQLKVWKMFLAESGNATTGKGEPSK